MKVLESKSASAHKIEQDPRWQAVVQRSAQADGTFFYSVKTTGVYCRPSCVARLARPENVAFYSNIEDAARAGFRPCKRCKPDQAPLVEQQAQKITEICRLIEASESIPSLDSLAAQAGLSVYHFHRLFKKHTGLTPREFADAHRSRRVRDQLQLNQSVTAAIYEAGFNSSGRFYAQTDDVLGMTPSDFRDGGLHAEIRFAIGECSLGSILVATTERGVCAILLGDDAELLLRDLQERFKQATFIGGDKEFEQLVARVVGFIEAPALGLDLPLDVRGTAFQQRVWQALRKIPVGSTATYSEIAIAIGAPKSARAVAQACAANALAVAIPCHRVVRNDGALSGYRWGVERKRSLLQREAK